MLTSATLTRPAGAVEVEMDVQPRVVQLGEACTLRLVVRDAQKIPPPRLPPLSGFEVVSTGNEQSFRFENGRQTVQTAFTFQLMPLAAGEYQIGPFRYDVGTTNVEVPAVQIQVLAPNAASTSEQRQRLDDLLFATLAASRPSVYVQEAFDLTISLYSQPGLNLDRNVGLLDFDTRGLAVDGFEELAGRREVVNGIPYEVRRFRARATALTAGVFTLSPKLRVNVIVPRSGSRNRDPFFGDSFFDSFFNRAEARPYTIEAQPLSLDVRPIPTEGRPSTFAGAVGSFTFDAHVAPTEVRVGDPVTLTMRIQGSGRLDTVQAPVLNLPDTFRGYEPRLIDEQPATGLKVFEQVIIPRTLAATEIPAIAFSYFEPTTGQFETIARGPFALTLKPGASADAAALVNRPRTSGDATIGADLVYLKPAPRTWNRVDHSPASAVSSSIQALPALALLLAYLYHRRQTQQARDPAAVHRRQAPRRARAGLARSRTRLKAGDLAGATDALSDAMRAFFGPLLNLPPGQITADEVCHRLAAHGLPNEQIDRLRSVFADAERLRYARPADQTQALNEMQRILDQMDELLARCQQVAR